MEEKKFRCLDCGWEGVDVEFDQIDTCMGADETEMCPECGSVNVVPFFTPEPKP
ncbi:hypothetical protein [Saccharicrinis sp. FJH54]|uniref:hypothetical protein n=1 Tax=Saccharicrinis sp. FJH54 TaxID=3344665 RepID=UPI0035D4371F